MGALAIIGGIVSFISGLTFLRYFLIYQFRLRSSDQKALFRMIKESKGIKLISSEEIIRDRSQPNMLTCLMKLKGYPSCFVKFQQRLLTTGWKSTDTVGTVTCFKWAKKQIRKMIDTAYNEDIDNVSTYILAPYEETHVGRLNKRDILDPIVDSNFLQMIEAEIEQCLSGKIDKTGILLHGKPGTGKSILIRYLALKYKLGIRLALFRADYSNEDIVMMFSQIPGEPAIILMEDFDSVFDKRTPLIGSSNKDSKSGVNHISFSFDTILNVLDGVYNSYEKCIFIMTANDIEKIDSSISQRPSRFKFIHEMQLPDIKVCQRIIGDRDLAKEAVGCNLDTVFLIKQLHDSGLSNELILDQVNVRKHI